MGSQPRGHGMALYALKVWSSQRSRTTKKTVPASQPSARASRGDRARAQQRAGASHAQAKSHQSVPGKASAPSTPPTMRRWMRRRTWARVPRRSDAMSETIRQRSRQADGDDLLRGPAVVVVDPPDADGPLVPIPDGVGGARVAITRLPHAAHVDDVAPSILEPHPGPRRGEASRVLRSAGTERPDIGAVGVADEAESRREIAEDLEAVLGRYQVVPLVGLAGARVDERRLLERDLEGQAL